MQTSLEQKKTVEWVKDNPKSDIRFIQRLYFLGGHCPYFKKHFYNLPMHTVGDYNLKSDIRFIQRLHFLGGNCPYLLKTFL